MNMKYVKEKVEKLLGIPLVKESEGVLELSQGKYVQLPSGLLIPKEYDDYTGGGKKEFEAMYFNKPAPIKEEEFEPSKYNIKKSAGAFIIDDAVLDQMAKDAGEGKPLLSDADYMAYTATQALMDIQAMHTKQAEQSHLTEEQLHQLVDELKKHAEKVTGVSEQIKGTHAGLIVADDVPVKFEDGQQVPQAIANQADIAPVGEPLYPGKIWFVDQKHMIFNSQPTVEQLELLGVVAYQIAHSQFDHSLSKNSIILHCGIEIADEILEDPNFIHISKMALSKHVAKLNAPQQSSVSEFGELQKKLAEHLGITAEEYMQMAMEYEPQPKAPVAITQGAFNALLKPGFAKMILDAAENALDNDPDNEALSKNQLSDVALAKQQEQYYGIGITEELLKDQLALAKLTKPKGSSFLNTFGPKPVTAAERIAVLETIVAGILLAPREMKMTDDTFIVSHQTMLDMGKVFHLKVVRKKGDFHITLE